MHTPTYTQMCIICACICYIVRTLKEKLGNVMQDGREFQRCIEELRESVDCIEDLWREEGIDRIERSMKKVLSVKLGEDRRKLHAHMESVEEDVQRLEERMQGMWDVQEEVRNQKVLMDRLEADVRWLKTSPQTFDLNALD